MQKVKAVNDFVVRFANVNGTGSASANNMFAKAVFRMGIPISPKNIFPSNIQGLPTWFEIRINDKGYLGRRAGLDLLVSVNPQSMIQDIASVKPGGYFALGRRMRPLGSVTVDNRLPFGVPCDGTPAAERYILVGGDGGGYF